MSNYPPQMPSPEPPRQGMSSGAKVFLILAIIFGVLVLLCCGGGVAVVFLMKNNLQVSQDAAEVRAATARITEIAVPAGLEPEFSFSMKVPVVHKDLMSWVMYLDQATNSSLVIASTGEAMAGQEQQLRQSIDQSLRQQGMGDHEDILVQRSEQKTVEIRGKQANFTISHGTTHDGQRKRIQVTGSFQGKSGPAMLMFHADANKYTEEQLVHMLQSIR